MKSILGCAFMMLAAVATLASCAPPAPDPVKRQALLQLEHQEAENTRAALEGRGVRPATAEEVIARRSGNTGSMSGGKVSFRTYYLPDGTVRAKLVTQRGYYRASGTWVVNDDGTRCITLGGFKGRVRGMFGWTDGVPSGAWTGSNETNCYQVYYEGHYEYWYLVSGPHFLKFGKTRLVPGNAYRM